MLSVSTNLPSPWGQHRQAGWKLSHLMGNTEKGTYHVSAARVPTGAHGPHGGQQDRSDPGEGEGCGRCGVGGLGGFPWEAALHLLSPKGATSGSQREKPERSRVRAGNW